MIATHSYIARAFRRSLLEEEDYVEARSSRRRKDVVFEDASLEKIGNIYSSSVLVF